MYAIPVNWQQTNENNEFIWIFTGRNYEEQIREDNNSQLEELNEDSFYPILNYAYPLESKDITDEKIRLVHEKTSCTIVFNTEEEKYYLALMGCGMDYSQDIAYAYVLLEEWIPRDLLNSIISQTDFTITGNDFKNLAAQIIKQANNEKLRLDSTIKEWKRALNQEEEIKQ